MMFYHINHIESPHDEVKVVRHKRVVHARISALWYDVMIISPFMVCKRITKDYTAEGNHHRETVTDEWLGRLSD